MSSCCESICRMPRRASGSSSAMMARILFIALLFQWKADRRDCSTVWRINNFKLAGGTIDRCKALSRISESQALFGEGVIPRTIIFYGQHQVAVRSFCRNLNYAILGAGCDSMSHGVFDQRLENKFWHESLAHLRIDSPPYLEPIRKTHLLDGKIHLDE